MSNYRELSKCADGCGWHELSGIESPIDIIRNSNATCCPECGGKLVVAVGKPQWMDLGGFFSKRSICTGVIWRN